MPGWLRLARIRASRSKRVPFAPRPRRAPRAGPSAPRPGRARVLRPLDLSHPARAEGREDLVGAEPGAGGKASCSEHRDDSRATPRVLPDVWWLAAHRRRGWPFRQRRCGWRIREVVHGSLLVLNAGSSTLKYAAYRVQRQELAVLARGKLEGTDPAQAFVLLDERLAAAAPGEKLFAVGHRIVHGGSRFATRSPSTTPSPASSTRFFRPRPAPPDAEPDRSFGRPRAVSRCPSRGLLRHGLPPGHSGSPMRSPSRVLSATPASAGTAFMASPTSTSQVASARSTPCGPRAASSSHISGTARASARSRTAGASTRR